MKVLLIYPLTTQRNVALREPGWVPLGLSYIAASLQKAGHSVAIFDRYAIQARIGTDRAVIDQAMLQKVSDFQPDLIGLNTVTPLIYDTHDCAKLIRKNYEGIMVAGGHHTSALPQLTLKRIPEIDGVVQGEGEIALSELAGGADPTAIAGLWWREDGGITHTAPQQIDELDQLDFPALDLLDMEFYCRPGRTMIRGNHMAVTSMLTSRGCQYKCSFCAESMTYGRGVRFHSPEYVIGWLKQVLADYPIDGVYFHDNDFLTDLERAAEICEGIIKLNLQGRFKFAIQTRVDRINRDILRLLKRAGCILVELGVESAVQDDLDWVKKQTTVDLNRQVIAMCRQEGIAVHAYMMTAFNGEKLADLERKLNWIKKVKPHTFSLHPLKIYPGTVLYEDEGKGFFEKNEWTEEQVNAFYRKDHFSSVTEDERNQWMKNSYYPYQVKRWRINLLKANRPSQLISLLKNKIKKKLIRG